MSKTVDMTHGRLGKKILFFALPLALTGILQQLFNAADSIVVGRFANKAAMAAVGSNSSIISLIVNLFVGVSLGANVVIARFTGQKDEDATSRGVHTAVLVSVLFGLLAAGIGEAIAGPLLHSMDVPAEVYPMAEAYLRIYLAGMPVIMLYNFESAIFRSQGNTRTPLICLVIAGVLNVFLNLFFVIVLHMAAAGVAIATVISNLVSSVLMFILLTRHKGPLHVQFSKLRIDWPILKKMMAIGIPSGIQGMMFSLSNIIIQSAINSLGTDVMAGSTASFNIEVFAYYLVNAFGQATTTFVSQNYGAGMPDRCKKTTRIAFGQDLLVTAVMSALVIAFAPQIIHIFNTDPVVIHYGTVRVRWIVGSEIINVFLEIFSGAMRGYGKSLTPAIITFFGVCILRIIYVYTYFRTHHTFDTLMMIYPISWVITAVLLVAAYFVTIGRLKKNGFKIEA